MPRDVFISYASEDKLIADAVRVALEDAGLRCWIAPRDIAPGSDYGAAIIDGLNEARVCVVVFSAHANASIHVGNELERALSKRVRILPLRIQDVIPTGGKEYYLARRHWLDALPYPTPEHLTQLVDAVRSILAAPVDQPAELPPTPDDVTPEAGALAAQSTQAELTTNLPASLSSFVGREDELEDIVNLLNDASVRLVTVTGPGGVGKTRLAVRAGERYAAEQDTPVCFVDLSTIDDPADVPSALGAALGIPQQPDKPMLDTLVRVLGSQRVLLICDNVEQVLGAATTILKILERAPAVKCLVTSRIALHAQGEHLYPVPPLEQPPSTADPQKLMEFASVRLFAERAREARPGWEITPDNAASVGELCARLEGIPLCIELAAARIRGMTAAEISRGLDDRLRILASRSSSTPDRHRTLRGTIDWSYELLDEEQRAVLAQLSTFQGGFAVAAAEAVTGDSLVLDLILDLQDHSLLAARQRGQTTRYHMLDAVREYATERLNEPGAEHAAPVLARHARFYQDLCGELAAAVRTPDEVSAIGSFSEELDNCRAALDWTRENAPEVHVALADAATGMLARTGAWDEARRWAQEALPVARGTADRGQTASLLLAMASVDHDCARLREAAQSATEALGIFEDLQDVRGQADALNLLGIAAHESGDSARARSFHERALELREQAGDRPGLARSLHNLGRLAQSEGDLDAARGCYEQALAIRRDTGDRRGLAETMCNLGVMGQDEGEGTRAAAIYRECLGIWAELGDEASVALILYNLGEVAVDAGRAGEALPLLAFSARTLRLIGSPHAATAEILMQRISDRPEAQPFGERLVAAKALGRDEVIQAALRPAS